MVPMYDSNAYPPPFYKPSFVNLLVQMPNLFYASLNIHSFI